MLILLGKVFEVKKISVGYTIFIVITLLICSPYIINNVTDINVYKKLKDKWVAKQNEDTPKPIYITNKNYEEWYEDHYERVTAIIHAYLASQSREDYIQNHKKILNYLSDLADEAITKSEPNDEKLKIVHEEYKRSMFALKNSAVKMSTSNLKAHERREITLDHLEDFFIHSKQAHYLYNNR